jgi:hypothetical protein
MDKILMEEDRMKKRKKLQPQLWSDAKREKSLVIKLINKFILK